MAAGTVPAYKGAEAALAEGKALTTTMHVDYTGAVVNKATSIFIIKRPLQADRSSSILWEWLVLACLSRVGMPTLFGAFLSPVCAESCERITQAEEAWKP